MNESIVGLNHSLLCSVSTPGQYVGREWNSVVKDRARVEVSFALAFPDAYSIGMSCLGIQVLYDAINRLEWAVCERVFSPWPDMEEAMRKNGIPLFVLESRRPVRDFDIVGFSLQHELCYTTVINMLDLAGIPIHSKDRGEDDPIILAGGPCAFNPLPMSRFIDAFIMGDGENAVVEFAEIVRQSPNRQAALEKAAEMPCCWVPALGKKSVRKAVVDIAVYPPPVHPVVPYVKAAQERYTVEITRGCARGCRFCNAGMIGRPVRHRAEDTIVAAAAKGYLNTGFEEVSLCALSAGDFPGIGSLLERLVKNFDGKCVNLSLPSLRVSDGVGILADHLAKVRKPGLTLAPEAGTERMRRVINKPILDADLLSGAEKALGLGWDTLKLYFMVGLPGENGEDLDAVARLVSEVGRAARRLRGGRAKINVTISPFVPKSHTPFQWETMAEKNYLDDAIRMIRSRIRGRHVWVKAHNTARSMIEGALARGDEEIGRVLESAWRLGCRLDEWDEWFDESRWRNAFAESNVDPRHCAQEERSSDERLPWDFIDTLVSRDWLAREWKRSRAGEITEDCVDGDCSECGACGGKGKADIRLKNRP